jgi:hypothetical protein
MDGTVEKSVRNYDKLIYGLSRNIRSGATGAIPRRPISGARKTYPGQDTTLASRSSRPRSFLKGSLTSTVRKST